VGEVAHGHAHEQDRRQCGQRGQLVASVAGDGRIQRGDVVAGQVADRGPHPGPEGRADRVQGQEPAEPHAGHAGDDPVGLPQHIEEPGGRHDLAAVPDEELLGLGHPVRREQHVPAEPGQHPVAAVMADGPADAVPRHRGHERHRGHCHDVQPACTRVDGGGDQHRLARHREAEVFYQQQGADRGIPVPVQVGRDGREQAG
jgi:hypothetical protein